ncbi:MAG: hypothetical protein U9R31_01240 [Candidatus Omnitrophota bacterium]|nr:hypothetical protein [Candidatus Omnitrophota bacterium]
MVIKADRDNVKYYGHFQDVIARLDRAIRILFTDRGWSCYIQLNGL